MSSHGKVYRSLVLGTVLAAGVILAHPGLAEAADTKTLTVTSTVVSTCTVTADPLSFGQVSQGGGVVDAQTTVHVNCSSPNDAWTVDFGGGQYAANNTRRMKRDGMNTEDYLQYNLYSSSSHTTLLGSGFMGGTNVPGGGSSNIAVYGRVPASQSPPTGNYSDGVVVTLTP